MNFVLFPIRALSRRVEAEYPLQTLGWIHCATARRAYPFHIFRPYKWPFAFYLKDDVFTVDIYSGYMGSCGSRFLLLWTLQSSHACWRTERLNLVQTPIIALLRQVGAEYPLRTLGWLHCAMVRGPFIISASSMSPIFIPVIHLNIHSGSAAHQ